MASFRIAAAVASAALALSQGVVAADDSTAAPPSKEHHWAVLVAGSRGYWNYRHQADVCHAYHILIDRGFHPERIITMMYDDAAHSTENPFFGSLYNYPWKSMDEAVDVYAGCNIDYNGQDVTPERFHAILVGDAETAGGKVLKSGPDDHVFVNFVDHGAVGLIAFPNFSEVMHAKDLLQALSTMQEKGMFKQLVFYLETCESGSMFEGLLPEGQGVYAVTAANAKESSWGTFCNEVAMVADQKLHTCLGDLFSVNWMMDSDKKIKAKETLKEQFARVQRLTNRSHVMGFGDIDLFGSELVSDFLGTSGEAIVRAEEPVSGFDVELAQRSVVDSRDAKLEYLRGEYQRSGSDMSWRQMQAEIEAKTQATALGERLEARFPAAKLRAFPASFAWTPALLECHAQAVAAFGASCGWSEDRLPLSRTLYKLCNSADGDQELVAHVSASVEEECKFMSEQFEIWA